MDINERIKTNILRILECDKTIYGINSTSAFIFSDVKMNFLEESYLNICRNEFWYKRLDKKHPHFNDGTKEMQSSNSSDALLMNIFCYPEINKWKGIKELLQVSELKEIEFGWSPELVNENPKYPTEIDLRINKEIICESKLTESNFTEKEKYIVEGYENFDLVFDKDLLEIKNGNYINYQLIRNILTAYKYSYRFILLIDETRIDLIRSLFNVVKAIKIADLRMKISFITWQELANKCGNHLKDYLSQKYF